MLAVSEIEQLVMSCYRPLEDAARRYLPRPRDESERAEERQPGESRPNEISTIPPGTAREGLATFARATLICLPPNRFSNRSQRIPLRVLAQERRL